MIGQARHLREITHRGLAAVGLPVRIGCERGRRAEGQGRVHIAEFLRIERQPFLRPLDEVENSHGYAAEQKHGHRIFRPAHLAGFIDAG